MKPFRSILVILFILIQINTLFAGWIIREQSYSSTEKTKYKYVYYIQDQKMKMVEDQLISIFDLGKSSMTFIVPEKNIYWTGSLEAYKKEFKVAIRETFMSQMKDASNEEKEMIQASFDYYLQSLDDSLSSSHIVEDMTLVNTGKSKKIAGKNAIMYGLFVNKILKEEYWISDEIPLSQQFDMVQFNKMLKEIGSDLTGDLSAQASMNFAQLLRKGMLMKTVEYTSEFSITTEVTKVKQSEIKASEFMPPAGSRKASLTELGLFEEY